MKRRRFLMILALGVPGCLLSAGAPAGFGLRRSGFPVIPRKLLQPGALGIGHELAG